ncbi:MAG: heavy metal-associated domain-containing protein [Nitrososphaerales archaeon]
MTISKTIEKSRRVTFTIPYTGCIDCHISNIKSNLKKLEGVRDVEMKLWTAQIEYYPSKISVKEIKKAITDLGYEISERN